MHNYTESTNVSVQYFQIKSVKDWAMSLIKDGKAPELLQLTQMIPLMNQLRHESILFDFLDMDEQVMLELIRKGKYNAELTEQTKGLHDRQEFWNELLASEKMYESSIKKFIPSNQPRLHLSNTCQQLASVVLEYNNKFAAFLERNNATKTQLASLRNLRYVTQNAINRFSYYIESVIDAIDIHNIKESMNPKERARLTNQQSRSAEKKRQNQGSTHNHSRIMPESNASKINWRATSAQKRK